MKNVRSLVKLSIPTYLTIFVIVFFSVNPHLIPDLDCTINRAVSNQPKNPTFGTISAGPYVTVGVRSDGTVVATSTYDDYVSDWSDVISVSASTNIFGVRSDGKVYALGYFNDYSQCDVSSWSDIIMVSADDYHTVGLRSDGNIVAVGSEGGVSSYGVIVAEGSGKSTIVGEINDNVSDWSNIVFVSAGFAFTVGVRSDGTVLCVGGNDALLSYEVADWKKITMVSAGRYHIVGLQSDGKVVAAGDNVDNQCNVSEWKNVVAVAAGTFHTVGLRSNGTVVAVGRNEDGQCNVSEWGDIIAIDAGYGHTVGLRSDGTVVAVGSNESGQCDVSAWYDIKTSEFD